MPTIYTVGYARLRDPERLADLAADLDAVVIDVRYKPYTSFKGWSRADLHARLGRGYRWVVAFGNEGYRGGPVRLHDPAGRPWHRLGSCRIRLVAGSKMAGIYGAAETWERLHHRYVLSPSMIPALARAGLQVSATAFENETIVDGIEM